MVWHPTKEAVQRLWGRRWVRRVSYLLVAGTATFMVTPWVASRPAVLRWATRRLDALLREETGLSLAIGGMEFHPALGTAALQNIRLGGDLLTIQRVEVHLDLWSLLGPTRRIYSVRLEKPHLRLTDAGLAAFKLKSHPPRTGPLPQIQLDYLSLTGGEIEVPRPVGNIPALKYLFEVKGTGLGPNQLRIDLTGAQLSVQSPTGWEKGRLDINGELSETTQIVREGYLRLGESQIRLGGRLVTGPAKEAARAEARLSGVVDLAQVAHWGGSKRAPMAGDLEIAATLQGPLNNPTWTLTAEGQDLRPAAVAFLPGNLDLKGSGSLDHARLERFHWASSQGEWQAEGAWSKKAPIEAKLHGAGLDLEAVGQALHVQELKGVRGALDIQIKGPQSHEELERPDRWKASVQATLSQHGLEAGEFQARLANGQLQLDQVRLDLESLKLEGSGQASLDARGLRQLDAKGRVAVGADQVAQALRVWKIVDLDMEGAADATAQVRWSRSGGLELDGSVQVAHPRWHGAHADQVLAKTVEIRGSDLRIKDIDLVKDQGRGGGDLWLTWAKLPPGQSQMDMCYTAYRLPVVEGLRAADLKDDEGNDLPLTGTGSGWVRLWGPFDGLSMMGSAQVESGETYGIKIPAASGVFWMDLETLHMKVSDVRLSERPDLLGRGELPPEGALALSGQADMDFRRWTWWVDLNGRVDSQLLALPGPRFQAQAQVRLLGPITSPFGSLQLPEGQAQWSQGRFFFGNRSVEGLEGQVTLGRGHLSGRVGIAGMARQVLDFQVHPDGEDLVGNLGLTISPESAQTGLLAQGLTNDLLEDLNLAVTAQGRWKGGRDLEWTGSIHRLAAQFSAFELHQSTPSPLRGNALGANLDLALEGVARGASAEATPKAAHVHLSGTLPFSDTAPLALRTQGDADLAHVKSILDRVLEVDEYSLLSDLSVQGTSRFNVLTHGTYFDPLLDGRLSLDKGRMNLRGYQGAEDIQGEAILKNRTLTIPEDKPVQGTLAHGALNASGTLLWRLGGLDSYAFKASLTNFQLRDVPDGLDLQGDLQATFNGNEEGGLLKGSLSADRLSYQTEVKLSDLILRSALSDSGTLTGLELDDPLERIRLDLDLELRTPWRFDTNLLKLDGRTEGPFQVVGTLGHPVPKGTMVFQPGGRVTNIFPAGDMVVDRGSLTFSEVRPLDPMISIQGSVTSIPGYTVNMDIHGTMSKLSVIPTSTPSLRQDEIMAILINPGNVNNVGTAGTSSGASQGAITSGLASAGSGLISTLAFAPLQEQVRRSLGLDRVNVSVRTTSLGNNETEVTIGQSFDLFGQRTAWVGSHRKSGELSISSVQGELRFGNLILQIGFTKGSEVGLSGEIRHTWSPK
ncbi:translocation/assembly module TamB domain-containing protein [Geothrix sp. PMB-07]|uniref:translocation/assembly module TamB domain-containing protein n=1 Tax=Geothrix sp. PMB-07 TaxID=3068640 RepID=UPI0027417A01|nr:translocation/assembly module TamB domain-containing protein [Geothrix sp. PMB-07]WLT29948.1 translocation/assembly module TamB domain-containing protein [Geothrix sp. PMB-07]